MNKQIKGLLYFYITDIRHSLLIFWSILLLVLIVSLAFSYYLLGIEDGAFTFGFPFAIYIYCIILGFLTVKETIPFAIKIGATRKNLFISLGIFFLGVALVKALVANTIQEIVLFLTKSTVLDNFKFLHPAMLVEDNWLNRVLIDTSLMFFLLAFMFIMGLLFYKYGLAGGGIVAGTLAIVFLIGIAKGWIFEFIISVSKQLDMVFFIELLGVGVVLYLFSFIFVRRVTIEKRN
ncbi:hypothetical protein [Ornithinibacillus bavariensis]|uniref:hypothetical protein n=1 Tax=Ornithinibacillus bavariensis TaxID=545502 RepID=UPI000EDE349B|nr:hypothetical protein [Ornithinibacillus sp.]